MSQSPPPRLASGGVPLDLKPRGPAKAVADVLRTLDGVALFAAGHGPQGPWRLGLSADPRQVVRVWQQGNPMRLTIAALIWIEDRKWGGRVEQALSVMPERLAGNYATDGAPWPPRPWFLLPEAELQMMLVRAAVGAGARSWDHAGWVGRVEELAAKEAG